MLTACAFARHWQILQVNVNQYVNAMRTYCGDSGYYYSERLSVNQVKGGRREAVALRSCCMEKLVIFHSN